MFKVAQYILDHKEVSKEQIPTIRNFGGEEPVYKHIKHTPTSRAIELLSEEWINRKPAYPNVRKEVMTPYMIKAAQIASPKNTWWDNNVRQNYDYLRYVLGHKYNVANAGVKLGLNPWTLIKHDYSKLKPSVFVPYRDYFYGPEGRLGTRSHDTYVTFRKAVGEHYLTEAHHSNVFGLSKSIETEMESVTDWYSVGKTNAQMQGKFFPDFPAWWIMNKEKFAAYKQIKPETIMKIDELLQQNRNIFSYLNPF